MTFLVGRMVWHCPAQALSDAFVRSKDVLTVSKLLSGPMQLQMCVHSACACCMDMVVQSNMRSVMPWKRRTSVLHRRLH